VSDEFILAAGEPGSVATLARTGNTAAPAVALDVGFPLCADALPLAAWRGCTDAVALLLARGAVVTASTLSLAERALTEMSEWTPHKSSGILDALRRATRQARG
jgi:hypothetical protein